MAAKHAEAVVWLTGHEGPLWVGQRPSIRFDMASYTIMLVRRFPVFIVSTAHYNLSLENVPAVVEISVTWVGKRPF